MQATVLPEARPLPAFELTDAQGSTFSRASLEGGWSLWFFGFTNCPDVCPMTLNVLAHARRQLADLAPPPTVVFVSLDPQRDEPAVIAEYIAYFDSEFVGVTGEPAALDALASRLGVAYGTTPTGSSSYTIDHTSALFLVNTRAELVAVFTPPHDARRISHDLRLLIAGDAERG